MIPEDHLPLAPRDLLVLAVLAEKPLHGYGIIKAVESRSRSGVSLDPANLYRVLRRMRKAGWIREASEADMAPGDREKDSGPGDASANEQSSAGTAHRRRRTYTITSDGRTLLAAELSRLERLLEHAWPAVARGRGR